jgi:hypothetical protein
MSGTIQNGSQHFGPPGTRLQFDYCVSDSQRFADLSGIKSDLESAKLYCDLHIEIDPTERGIPVQELSRRESTRQALCRAALVMYGRAFGWGSGLRSGLSAEHVEQLSRAAQEFHATVKPLRDKWVAHAVNHFEEAIVQIEVQVAADGSLKARGVSLMSRGIGGFVQAWMTQFRDLIAELLVVVEAELKKESERLSAIVKQMPIEDILSRERTEHAFVGRAKLKPDKNRSRFSE